MLYICTDCQGTIFQDEQHCLICGGARGESLNDPMLEMGLELMRRGETPKEALRTVLNYVARTAVREIIREVIVRVWQEYQAADRTEDTPPGSS